MHLLRAVALLAIVFLVAPAAAQDSTSRATTAPDSAYRRDTFASYVNNTFGPRPALRAIALAGFNQWRGSPRHFPRTWRGYEDRLGTAYAQVAISHTLRSATAWLVDERTMPFRRCVCTDSSRLRYAIESPFRVITPHGVRLSVYNPITEVVSGVLVTPLHGSGVRVGEGIANGLVGIAGESAWAIVREFWPWHWRPPFTRS